MQAVQWVVLVHYEQSDGHDSHMLKNNFNFIEFLKE